MEELEDEEGNVYNKKVYNDLKAQGEFICSPVIMERSEGLKEGCVCRFIVVLSPVKAYLALLGPRPGSDLQLVLEAFQANFLSMTMTMG